MVKFLIILEKSGAIVLDGQLDIKLFEIVSIKTKKMF